MNLPVPLDYAPMEAKLVTSLPKGDHWQFEPKWDGFRCLAFRDGVEIELRSKSGQPLTRYFPEVEGALRKVDATQFVLDGELVVPVDGDPSFDHLLQRIHPAASRVRKLATETPACFIIFDLLVDASGDDLTGVVLQERRPRLEKFFRIFLEGHKGFDLSPCSDDRDVAEDWLSSQEGTDGVMAKRLDQPYCSGERTAMQKVKRMKTADCVVGGIRYASKGNGVGSLLLGLYGD
ncbi:MAG TPA: ATP-dependent DNA ligase, partial [Gemmatimonadaceae bacterium]|nr:ATP-dependent DNA ligase [Gemmatimonadaceae bacterium]